MPWVLDLLFPRKCYDCGKIGQYFCNSCRQQILINSLEPQSNRLSLFKSQKGIKQAILDLKYNFVTDLVDELAELSADSIKGHYSHLWQFWQQNHYLMTAVPLHWWRYNWRSFNQADLLAKNIARRLKLDYRSDLLIKTRHTSPQARLQKRISRLKNVDHAFALNPSVKNQIGNLILFDDVYTTGSTLRSAAEVLKTYCQDIWFLTLAG